MLIRTFVLVERLNVKLAGQFAFCVSTVLTFSVISGSAESGE